MENPRPQRKSRVRGLAGKSSTDPLELFSPSTASVFRTPDKSVKEIIKGKQYRIDCVVKAGKHGQVAFGTGDVTPSTRKFACKTQVILAPKNQNDRAYRELLILKQLNKLRKRPDIYPNHHFVGFIRLLEGFQGYNSPQSGNEQILNLILDKADCTLHDKQLLSLFEMRSILFQLIFALAVSQEEFEFVHRDLHLQVRKLHSPPACAHSGPECLAEASKQGVR